MALIPKFLVSVSNFDTKKIWLSVLVSDSLTPKILMSVSDVFDTRKTGVGVGVGFVDTQSLIVGVGRLRHQKILSVSKFNSDAGVSVRANLG